jgi:alkylation response protein AidB-like acyl-CoA dehydrogenase
VSAPIGSAATAPTASFSTASFSAASFSAASFSAASAGGSGAIRWLAPLRELLPALRPADWARLEHLDTLLGPLVEDCPPAGHPDRSAALLEVRRHLAGHGYTTSLPNPTTDRAARNRAGRAVVAQALAQFVCGWHDLDLRDATGAGHGALIRSATCPRTRRRWSARLAAGDLVGIAATERHGGSRIQEITTRAVTAAGGRWLVSGEKVWISRLCEAAGLVVFFRDPDGRMSAALVDAAAPGLDRQPLPPSGLAGWSWGVLRLHQVPFDPDTDLIGAPGQGLEVFRDHFAGFRPLVTATALGTAAGVHATVTQTLAARVGIGMLPRVRDHALIALGHGHAALTGCLLSALATATLTVTGHPDGDLWARGGKAYGVDTAIAVVDQLVPLVGAAGFTATSPLAKARADLAALRYADGIHDSLCRSAGRTLITAASPAAGLEQPLTVMPELPATA